MKANYLPSYAFIRPKQLVLVQEKVLKRMAVIHFSKVKQLVLHQKWWIFHIENATFSISQTSHFTSSIVASMNKRTGQKTGRIAIQPFEREIYESMSYNL